MTGGPQPPRSCLARLLPVRRNPEEQKQNGWRNHGILVVALDDARLAWPERELLRQLGEKLYGARAGKEVRHG